MSVEFSRQFATVKIINFKTTRENDRLTVQYRIVSRELKQATFCQHGREIAEGDWIKNCVCVSLW
jgi:hypothetical protein